MQLFTSDRYSQVNADSIPVLPTSIGSLERRYVNNTHGMLQMQKHHYRHRTQNSTVYEWLGPNCVLEELVTDYDPEFRVLPPECSCQAIVTRLRALAPLQNCEARISWQNGAAWNYASGESGEALEARSWTDGSWKVMIGTEDTDCLASRSLVGEWMPRRFASQFKCLRSEAFRIWTDTFGINLASVEAGEVCQLQFLVAQGPLDFQTDLWLAVDQRPEYLLLSADCQ